MTNNPLKLGYKASAEQFGPRQLLNFAIEAEECGFDSVWVSQPFPAVAAYWRPCAPGFCMARRSW